MNIIGKILIASILFTSCIPMQKVPKEAKMTDFFHFQKAAVYDASKWAVFLPGTGGLKIFKDTTHYYNVAKKLNDVGISVLLVDNVAAYKASKRNVPEEEEPDQILWVLKEALKWAKNNGAINSNSKGSIVGWSRAGLGLIPLANDTEMLSSLSIESIAMFYPANGYQIPLKPKVPVLVLTGGKDRIVKIDAILKHMISEDVTLKIYNEAYHGFDVKSLEKGKYFRHIPFISEKKYLLKYNEEAATDSFKQLIEFLK